jgi:hypothetical protein
MAVAVALGPGVAHAHGVGGSRFDAPLPLSLLFVGAGATVALTALWLALTDRSAATSSTRVVLTVDARVIRGIRVVAGAVFFLGVMTALVAGTVGRQVAAENFATVFTWPVWFRGVALLAVLFGTPWPALSPWRALYRGLCRLEGDRVARYDYPPRLGTWPALVGFLLLLGVVENLTVVPRSPSLTTALVAAYGLAMVGGAVLFGPTWFDRADPLGVLYRLLGRVSGVTVERTAGGESVVALRPPWVGCLSPVRDVTTVAFVIGAVYTVSFDGFVGTRLYRTLLFGVRDTLGTGPPTSLLLYLVGLALFVGTFLAATVLGDVLGGSVAPDGEVAADGGLAVGWRGAARAFAPTVLPIAAAYDVAHNYPYVVENTARLIAISVESLPGAAFGPLDPLGWLSLPAFWGSQVVLIVVGHVVAVVAAHRVAARRFPSRSAARRGHLPLVVVMIGYTVLSLWIVSRSVVM